MIYAYPHFMPTGSGWAGIVIPLLLAVAVAGLMAFWPAHHDSGADPERRPGSRSAGGETGIGEHERHPRTPQAAHR
ncbi:hypothetical protein [Actinoplanes sp. L3-i22]|uniref:hypothetical protein n=1 Tax=Actinoplanes sp. L3-i22 TaxID=2836373 RepID=UPI001C78840B|nr:hypothetical protein [Actinoplanes sp. L3-i22]BCY09407.1 hypothetical protein L3i22_044950 [Actinoplanes sp. L3-i22]